VKVVRPSQTLLKGQPYRPSWLQKIPVRYTIPKLGGHYGLHSPQLPEGHAHEDDGHSTTGRVAEEV
jgi:hypothetical protein